MNLQLKEELRKARRREYMRRYRLKNRARLNAYHRYYLRDPKRAQRHKEACERYRKNSMSDETKEKIRQYQHEYYEKRKQKGNKAALDQFNK